MKKLIEHVIFNVKWLLPIFYFGLIIVMFMYGFAYFKEVIHLISRTTEVGTDEMKIMVLDMVDIVMVANLVKMIITGSYNSFVSKSHGRANENISSGTLKIKISTSIITVASVHLLKTFVTGNIPADIVKLDLEIFGMFLACAVALGVLEYLHVCTEVVEHDMETQDEQH
jgi:uncharacterized protein (TIGR00645 family)